MLNMHSNAVMALYHRIYDCLMIAVKPSNVKLLDRTMGLIKKILVDQIEKLGYPVVINAFEVAIHHLYPHIRSQQENTNVCTVEKITTDIIHHTEEQIKFLTRHGIYRPVLGFTMSGSVLYMEIIQLCSQIIGQHTDTTVVKGGAYAKQLPRPIREFSDALQKFKSNPMHSINLLIDSARQLLNNNRFHKKLVNRLINKLTDLRQPSADASRLVLFER